MDNQFIILAANFTEMITKELFERELDIIISNAIREDVGDGDHSSLACIPENARGKAKLLVKDKGIIAGVNYAKRVFAYVDKSLKVTVLIEDGSEVNYGDVVLYVEGSPQSILKCERTVLNGMQRMSAIATKTSALVEVGKGTNTKISDPREPTPGIRKQERWADQVAGGANPPV